MLVKSDHGVFKAQLRLESGEVLADGRASADIDQKAVNFESDFVPLYPLGTPMEIVRQYCGKDIHRFSGKVYLSDKKLMRIVSVRDELLPGAELFYCDKKPFTGTLRPHAQPVKTEPRPLFKRAKAKSTAEPVTFSARITEITDRHLVFLYDIEQQFDIGTRFLLKADLPLPLPPVNIEITKPFYFGQSACYICKFLDLQPKSAWNLRAFLWDYTLKTCKLF